MKGGQQLKNADQRERERERLRSLFILDWSWGTDLLFRTRPGVVRILQNSNTPRQSSGKLVGGKLCKICPQRAQEIIFLQVFFAACLPWV